jgi:hypothetical protein
MSPRRTLPLFIALLLAGCARVAPPQAGDGALGRDLPGLSTASCSTPVVGRGPEPAPSTRPLPTDFTPVTARRCVPSTVVVPGDGEWRVHDDQEATGGLEALTEALRRPSSPQGNAACPAIAVAPVEITLVDAGGRTLNPAVPVDGCGFPQRGVLQAIESLPWKSVKQTKVDRLRGQVELDSGCAGQYKPIVDLATTGRTPTTTGPVFGATAPGSLTVCAYRLDPANPISLDNGPLLATGVLDRATTVTGADLTRLLAALDAAKPVTGRCDKPQQRFAVLFPTGSPGPWIGIELGGCYRFVDGDGQLRQLDAATVALVVG